VTFQSSSAFESIAVEPVPGVILKRVVGVEEAAVPAVRERVRGKRGDSHVEREVDGPVMVCEDEVWYLSTC